MWCLQTQCHVILTHLLVEWLYNSLIIFVWINAFIIFSADLVILHGFIVFLSRNFLRPWLIYILLRLILHINIFKKCITCNFSSLTLAHSQAGRRADDKAEEAGVLVFYFHLFFFSLLLHFVSLNSLHEACIVSLSMNCNWPIYLSLTLSLHRYYF